MWQFHPYSVLLFLAFGSNVLLGLFLLKSIQLKLGRYLLLLVLGSSLWTGFYGLDFCYLNHDLHKLFIYCIYIGVCIANFAMVLVALEFTDQGRDITKQLWVLLSIQPFLIISLIVLDPMLKTLISDTYLAMVSNRIQWKQEISDLGFFVAFGISALWAIYVSYKILSVVPRAEPEEKKRYIIILLSYAVLWITSSSHNLGFRPLPGLNLTSVMCTFQAILLFFAIGYYRMYDLLPLARSEIVDELFDAVVILDSKLRVVDWNLSAESLFGIDKKVNPGTGFKDFFRFPDIIQRIESLSEKRGFIKWNWENEDYSWEVSVKRIKDSLRKNLGIVLVFRETTDQRKIEKQMAAINRELEQANASKDRFLSIISHDLRGPLAGIKMLLRIMHDETKALGSEQAQMTKSLVDATENIYGLLENLLEWAKIQNGKENFKPHNYKIEDIVEECLEIFELNAQTKSLEFDIDIPNHAMCYCDDRMIVTVLRNLISNAIKFSHKGSQIQIYARDIGDHWKIFVKDHGLGMESKTLESLFLPSSPMQTIGTMGETGNGIGLILVDEFVRKNGGSVSVESELMKGSTFSFSLPKWNRSFKRNSL